VGARSAQFLYVIAMSARVPSRTSLSRSDGEGDRSAQPSGGGAKRVQATGSAIAPARKLRRQLSLPEMLLWRLLRVNRPELRFRKQHPIGPYVADFYCPAAKIVIEVDGATHDWRSDADRERDD
jgi:hypothetical protein